MNNESWIKLYRKLDNNKLLQDALALQVFIYLLINVDRKTGELSIGRYALAGILRMNPNTLKSVIKRLTKRHQIITSYSTNRYTTIRLINWDKYQPDNQTTPQDDTSKTPAKHQQNTTYTRIENKERDIEKEKLSLSEKTDKPEKHIAYLKNIPDLDVIEMRSKVNASVEQIRLKAEDLHSYCEAHGKRYKNYKAFLLTALRKDFPQLKQGFDAYGYRLRTEGIN